MIEFGLSRSLSRIVTVTDLRMERILPAGRLCGSANRTQSAPPAPWPDISTSPPRGWRLFDGTAVFMARAVGADGLQGRLMSGRCLRTAGGAWVMSVVECSAADWPDWWDTSSYGYTAHLTRRDWAWEFLRRNAAFRHDLAQALERAEWLESRSSLDIIASRVDLARRGVLFRGLPRA
ncbi:transcriptional regulator domain-containing protein [Mesorhizobium sp. AaZ16]|uniref:transcriptional regulator domain-containing protein n=1 Tax=Mesorhizobium sp. AaZ16 TaxID=3402289 RepID=UPI00374FD301